jgi:hypothetical protein
MKFQMVDLVKSISETPQILFNESLTESESVSINDLIKIVPYGISVGPEMIRPILIMKAETSDLTMPVPLNPLEAGVTLSQFNKSSAPITPHKATQELLRALGVKIEKAVFVEIKGQYQFLKLFISGYPLVNEVVKEVKVRADEAMSLCLYFEVPIYTTQEMAVKSRILNAELEHMKKEVRISPQIMNKNHPYIN